MRNSFKENFLQAKRFSKYFSLRSYNDLIYNQELLGDIKESAKVRGETKL
jgi:hypothetical protein